MACIIYIDKTEHGISVNTANLLLYDLVSAVLAHNNVADGYMGKQPVARVEYFANDR